MRPSSAISLSIGGREINRRRIDAMAKTAKKATPSIWVVTSDAKIIAKQRAALREGTVSLRDQAAYAAASCVVHMLEHGNATAMTMFVRDAAELGLIRADAAVKWAIGLKMFRVAKE